MEQMVLTVLPVPTVQPQQFKLEQLLLLNRANRLLLKMSVQKMLQF